MKLKLYCLIIFTCLSFSSYAQIPSKFSFALTNESISFPGTRFLPVHPGVEIGMSLKEFEKTKNNAEINVYFGYFHHKNLANAFSLRCEYLYQLTLAKNVGFDLFTGIGYMHTFNPTEIYEVNKDGEFEAIIQFGRPHLIADVGIGFSMFINKKIVPFVRYHFMIETPFANGIPVIPHSMYQIGTNIKLNRNEKY